MERYSQKNAQNSDMLDKFTNQLLYCDKIIVRMSGVGETEYSTKEIYKAIVEMKAELSDLKNDNLWLKNDNRWRSCQESSPADEKIDEGRLLKVAFDNPENEIKTAIAYYAGGEFWEMDGDEVKPINHVKYWKTINPPRDDSKLKDEILRLRSELATVIDDQRWREYTKSCPTDEKIDEDTPLKVVFEKPKNNTGIVCAFYSDDMFWAMDGDEIKHVKYWKTINSPRDILQMKDEILRLRTELENITKDRRWRKQADEPIDIASGEFIEVYLRPEQTCGMNEDEIETLPLRPMIVKKQRGTEITTPGVSWDVSQVVYWRPWQKDINIVHDSDQPVLNGPAKDR